MEWIKKIQTYEDKLYTRWLKNMIKISYGSIYKNGSRNSYENIYKYKNKYGVYVFSNKDVVLYVGEASIQDLYTRIQQHFKDKDTGGLRHKLRKDELKLEKLFLSDLYIIPMGTEDDREILFMENFLISKLRPEFNY